MTRLARLIFGHFWATVALAAAVGEWTLACWLLGPPATWLAHAAGVLGLAATNRLAAWAYERERHAGFVLHATGGITLAVGVIATIGAVTFAATAAGWYAMSTLTAFPAQAGALEMPIAARFGGPFHALAGVTVAAAMAVGAWGYTHGHRRLRVIRLDVPVATLPPALDGLRIVHITDLHLGPTAHRGALREALDRVNALEPDLICVTGDTVDSGRTDVDSWLPELARLRARHGVFAVLGNHDGRSGAERVATALRTHTTWRLLRDEVETIEIDGARLHLAGMEDRPGARTAAALPGVLAAVPAGEPYVLLVHQPAAFPAAAALGVPLMLSGHTHGGQIAVPGLSALNPARFLMTRYDAGTFASGASLLHVNRGLGASGQRIRVAAPREITVVTLLAAPAVAAA